MSPRESEKAYKVPEAARIKSVSPQTIRRALAKGDLEAKRLGSGNRDIRISASALDDWFSRMDDFEANGMGL